MDISANDPAAVTPPMTKSLQARKSLPAPRQVFRTALDDLGTGNDDLDIDEFPSQQGASQVTASQRIETDTGMMPGILI